MNTPRLVLALAPIVGGCTLATPPDIPTPAFDRAVLEPARAADENASPSCDSVCRAAPDNERIVGCQPTNLSATLVAHRKGLGDKDPHDFAWVCLYQRRAP
ncbi:MAG: hypothetical protein U0271_18170 [Polyangiaceae bacterium]